MIKIYKLILLGLLTSYSYGMEDILNCKKAELYSKEDFICNSYSLKEIATEEEYTYKKLLESKPNESERIKKEKDDWKKNELNSCNIKDQKKYQSTIIEEKRLINQIKRQITDEDILKREIYLALKIRAVNSIKNNKEFYNESEATKCFYKQYSKRNKYYIREKIDSINEEDSNSISGKSISKQTEEGLEKFKKELTTIEDFQKDNLTIIDCKVGYETLAGKINSGYVGICNANKDNKKIEIYICYNLASAYTYEETTKEDTEKEKQIKAIEFLFDNCYGG